MQQKRPSSFLCCFRLGFDLRECDSAQLREKLVNAPSLPARFAWYIVPHLRTTPVTSVSSLIPDSPFIFERKLGLI